MEKYLIIILIIIIVYYIIKYWNQKIENFADANAPQPPTQSITGVDDSNAINTLATLAKQLITDGLTVPGKLNFINKNNVFSSLNIDNDDYFRIKNKDGNQVFAIGQNSEAFIGMQNKDDGPLTCGNITSKGNLNVNGNITANTGALTVGKGATLTGDVKINDNLTVNKNLIRMNPVYRKHDIAGYYQVRGHGWKVPIYYGFNMMWNDHDLKERVRAINKWDEYMFNNVNVDMRQSNDNDQNWTARYLTLFPGYKARMYSWGDDQFQDRDNKIFTSGEYPFTDNNKRIHCIFVDLEEDKLLDNLINIKQR